MLNKNERPLVLIVDDNAKNLQFLGNLLSENGYRIGVAQDGYKALEFVRYYMPDLILLDIMMPDMTGYEVCKHFKLKTNTSHIPVIFLTAKTEPEDIVKGFDVGGVDYVTKPFNPAELLARVKTHLEVKTLRGLIPVCAKCKDVLDDEGLWKQIEEYIAEHSDAMMTHSICPKCSDELYGGEEWYKSMKGKRSDVFP